MSLPHKSHKRTLINGILTVESCLQVSSNLIEIVFSCDKQLEIDPLWIGPHVKLLFPSTVDGEIVFPQYNEENKIIWQAGLRERVRTYSIRDHDPQKNTITLCFIVHPQGIATTWAQNAKVGERIGLVTMGSKRQFDHINQLVLLGDISAMPAICYTLEHLPATQQAIAIIEVRSETDIIMLKGSANKRVHWLVTPQGEESKIMAEVEQLNLATEETQLLFWGGMETAVSQKLRHFLKDRFVNLSHDGMILISYWREGYVEGQFKHHD